MPAPPAPVLPVFRVWLERDDSPPLTVDVAADGRHLAARLAELSHVGCRTVAVGVRWDVSGQCARCGAVLFADERPRSGRDGLRCFEC